MLDDHDNGWIPNGSEMNLSGERQRLYYLHDDLGSVTKVVGENGKTSAHYNYDEFGVPKTSVKFDQNWLGPDNTYGYTGYQYDVLAELWYAREIAQNGGYGPTAATNITAYLAQVHPDLSNLYEDDFSKKNFVKHMVNLYKHVTSLEIGEISIRKWNKVLTAGVPTLDMFSRGVEEYAKEKRVSLKANYSNQKPTLENAVGYIKDGLKKDSPVALLNLKNSNLKEITYFDIELNRNRKSGFEWHCVTITAVHENTQTGEVYVDVSSWGNKATLNFKDVWKPGTGILYFDWE